jgi:hypothetical protein
LIYRKTMASEMAMALQRRINWTAGMRDIRRDRAKSAAGFLAARSMEVARLDRMAKEAAMVPFVVGAPSTALPS